MFLNVELSAWDGDHTEFVCEPIRDSEVSSSMHIFIRERIITWDLNFSKIYQEEV